MVNLMLLWLECLRKKRYTITTGDTKNAPTRATLGSTSLASLAEWSRARVFVPSSCFSFFVHDIKYTGCAIDGSFAHLLLTLA